LPSPSSIETCLFYAKSQNLSKISKQNSSSNYIKISRRVG
jgi:hypothetical protein